MPGEQCVVLISAVVLSYFAIVAYGAANIRAGFFLDAVCSNPYSSNKIAITFDDGPHAENTEKILSLLSQYNAKASFFMTGKHAEKYPEIVLKVHNKGHLVGNHSYNHNFLFPVEYFSGMLSDVSHAQNVLTDIVRNEVRYFRPPFGVTNPTVARVVKRLNLVAVGWSIRTFDTTNRSREAIIKNIRNKLKAGDIILLHDHSAHAEWLLEQILQLAKERNFEPVTVETLLSDS